MPSLETKRPVAAAPAIGPDPYDALIRHLEDYALAGYNTMLIGDRGVGKTSIVIEIAQKLELRFAYFSAPTLDPWADLLGVPVPREGQLAFLRPARVSEAEFLFLDELNRAHPRVQNAVLELTLFKTLNGERLEHLRMVWAAINPPDGQYQVFDLDPALHDRFPFQVSLPYQPSSSYFLTHYPESVARALLEWWHRDLNAEQRKAITPRRLAWIGDAHLQGLSLEHIAPHGVTVPLHLLVRALNAGDHLRLEDLLQAPMRFKNAIREDLNFSWRFLHLLDTCSHEELYALHGLILELPAELLMSLKRQHSNTYQKLQKAIRLQHGNTAVVEYDRQVTELTRGVA